MAVRDPYAENAERRPLPSIEMGGRQERKSERGPSLKERYVDALTEGAEWRGFMQGMGISPSEAPMIAQAGRSGAPQVQDDARAAHSVLDIVKAQADTNIKMMDKLLEKAGGNKEESTFLKYLIEEMRSVRAQLDNRETDPAAIVEQQNRMVEAVKKSMGITGHEAAAGGGRNEWDLKYALEVKKIDMELKRLDMDREERTEQWRRDQRRWDEEQEERRRRWRIEDKHHDDEMALKRQELNQNSATKDKALGKLTAVADAFIGGIDEDMGAASAAARQADSPAPQQPARDHFPASFKCEVCKNMVAVSPDDQRRRQTICTTCGTVYDLLPQDTPGGGTPLETRAPAPQASGSSSLDTPPAPPTEEAEEVDA